MSERVILAGLRSARDMVRRRIRAAKIRSTSLL